VSFKYNADVVKYVVTTRLLVSTGAVSCNVHVSTLRR